MVADAELLADSPVGYWPLDGDLFDASGNGDHLSVDYGSTSFVADATFTTVSEGNGGGVGWSSAATPGMSEFTVEMWVNGSASGGIGLALADGLGGVAFLEQNFALSKLETDGGSTNITGAGATIGEWHHVAGTWDGSSIVLYVDGVQVGTAAWSTGWGAAPTVGFSANDDARVARVALFADALSSARVAAHFGEVPQPWTGSVAAPATTDVSTGTSSVMLHALDVVEAVPVGTSVTAGTALIGIATVPASSTTYQAANPGAPTWTSTHGQPLSVDIPLNGHETAEIEVPIDWAQPANLARVEVKRNGHRKFYGRRRNLGDDTGSGAATYTCLSDWHLFRQRYAGDPNRHNFLPNGYFETWASEPWLDHWSGVNVVASSESEIVLTGKHAVRLESFSTDEDTPSHYDSAFTRTSLANLGTHFYASAWVYIDGNFLPGYKTFGLRIRWDDGEDQFDQTTLIDSSHPSGRWVRHYVDLPVRKPETLGLVVVELWCVRGAMIWDHVQVVGVGADGIPSRFGSDQTLVAGSFIRAAQNPALGHRPLGVGTVTPPSGVLSTEMMLHHEHEQYAQKIEEMANRDDGFDFGITTAGDTQTFRTWAPRRTRSAPALTFPGNCAQYRRTELGVEAESSVITLGDSGDPAREEGGAWDDEALEGLGLEGVHPTPKGMSIGLLWPKAQEILRQRVVPPQTIDAVVKGDLGDSYEPGDILTFTADRGNLSFTGEYRVNNIRINCRADEFTLSLALWIEPEDD